MVESTIQVDGLLTALCARNVEKALLKMPGVQHAVANCLNSTATVHYDEMQVTLAQLQVAVADCGYVCAGEALPDHMAHASHGCAAGSLTARGPCHADDTLGGSGPPDRSQLRTRDTPCRRSMPRTCRSRARLKITRRTAASRA